MRYWCDFILHYLSSNSRHGTHSPFVYKMADKVIYSSSLTMNTSEKSKVDRLISELRTFFKTEEEKDTLVLDIKINTLKQIKTYHRNFPFVVLKNLYKTKEAKIKWTLLLNDPDVLVTIDLFYFGILIHRQEQRKENFKLRFPFGKY